MKVREVSGGGGLRLHVRARLRGLAARDARQVTPKKTSGRTRPLVRFVGRPSADQWQLLSSWTVPAWGGPVCFSTIGSDRLPGFRSIGRSPA